MAAAISCSCVVLLFRLRVDSTERAGPGVQPHRRIRQPRLDRLSRDDLLAERLLASLNSWLKVARQARPTATRLRAGYGCTIGGVGAAGSMPR